MGYTQEQLNTPIGTTPTIPPTTPPTTPPPPDDPGFFGGIGGVTIPTPPPPPGFFNIFGGTPPSGAFGDFLTNLLGGMGEGTGGTKGPGTTEPEPIDVGGPVVRPGGQPPLLVGGPVGSPVQPIDVGGPVKRPGGQPPLNDVRPDVMANLVGGISNPMGITPIAPPMGGMGGMGLPSLPQAPFVPDLGLQGPGGGRFSVDQLPMGLI